MSTTITSFAHTQPISNLDTYVYTMNTTAMHVAKIRMSIIPPSGISILIKQNSSTVATLTTPTAAQGHVELSATINATSGDTVSFVIASSTATDQGPNCIAGLLDVHIGSSN